MKISKELIVGLALIVSPPLTQAIDVQNYWIVPQNRVVNMTYQLNGVVQGVVNHAFYQGSLNGKPVYVQGGEQTQGGDFHWYSGTDLMYTGTFSGNSQTDADSAAFSVPILWMRANMNVGDFVETTHSYMELDPTNRKATTGTLSQTARIEIIAQYTAGNPYPHPENGVNYTDLIHFKYWPNKNVAGSVEEYWCQRGLGTVRAIQSNIGTKTWLTTGMGYLFGSPWNFGSNGYVDLPTGIHPAIPQTQNPWYSVEPAPVAFGGTYFSGVINGCFEAYHSSNGMSLTGANGASALWSGSSGDCVVTNDPVSNSTDPDLGYLGLDYAGAWRACLRGSTGGGDSSADGITTYNWIPVIPNKSYTLSGWIYRESSSDGAYLDLNDGNGLTSSSSSVSFTDIHAGSTATTDWEYVSNTITIPSNVYAVKVRCVREGANVGNAYFDDVRFRPSP